MDNISKTLFNLLNNKDINFWIRNDDVGLLSKNFERINSLYLKYKMPVIYAVIPTKLSSGVIELIKTNPYSFVVQHGLKHQNNSFGAPCELCDKNLVNDLLVEKEKLKKIFGKQFLDVIVPPFNSITNDFADAIKPYYNAVSTFLENKTSFITSFNPNVEMINWKNYNKFRNSTFVCKEINKAIENKYQYIGLCVHHELLGNRGFYFLECLFKTLSKIKSISCDTEFILKNLIKDTKYAN